MARPKKTENASKQWPIIRALKRKGGISFQLDTRALDGKQPKFKTREQAEARAEMARRELANSGLGGFTITTAQREDAKQALEKLASVGLGHIRLEEAASFYILHNRPAAGEDKTLEKLCEDFLKNRHEDGVRPVTLKGYEGRLKQFRKELGDQKLVREITEQDVKDYLARPYTPPGNQPPDEKAPERRISIQHARNDYAVLWSLFEFAMRPKDYHGSDTKPDAPITGWIAKNPLLSIRRPKLKGAHEREPSVLDAGQAAALLKSAFQTRHAPGDKRDPSKIGMLAEVVLELFVGVRPDSEIPHLRWSDIELSGKKGFLNITRSKNQAGSRNINLPPIALEWLRLCPDQSGVIHIAKNYRRRWERLKKLAGFTKWEQDCLRHTAASVHYRLGQDAGKTRAHLGHSKSDTGTLFSHYRALMSEATAKKIMALTPAAVLGSPDNIVSFAKSSPTAETKTSHPNPAQNLPAKTKSVRALADELLKYRQRKTSRRAAQN